VSIGALPSVSRHFRCDDALMNFKTLGALSESAGFFRFADAVCFGRSTRGALSPDPKLDLHDVSPYTQINGGSVALPFDADEVLRNLREERYSTCSGGPGLSNKVIRDLYYAVRPWMPLAVRKHLQRIYLRGWDKVPFPSWPVDRTADILLQKLLALALTSNNAESIPFIWFWPEGAKACAVMTHDVEAEPGKEFCSGLMDINDSFGIPASFQIVPEERYSVEPKFLEEIKRRGFEVNVQDLNHDGKLFLNRSEFERRVRAINRYGREYEAVGFRSAVLYRNEQWFDLLEFEYDMSVPSVAHLDPQRGGCCTIMPYFIGDLLELPVTMTQDHSLFNVLNDFTLELWQRQVQLVLTHHGLMNFIIHPDYILTSKAQRAYKELLASLVRLRADEGLWVALPKDVNRWWRQRDQMVLRREGSEWVIEGDGSEKARVAFATLQDDRLVYSVAQQPKSASTLGCPDNASRGENQVGIAVKGNL
jgi:hypothetical protein